MWRNPFQYKNLCTDLPEMQVVHTGGTKLLFFNLSPSIPPFCGHSIWFFWFPGKATNWKNHSLVASHYALQNKLTSVVQQYEWNQNCSGHKYKSCSGQWCQIWYQMSGIFVAPSALNAQTNCFCWKLICCDDKKYLQGGHVICTWGRSDKHKGQHNQTGTK